jgi:hypothetical protein
MASRSAQAIREFDGQDGADALIETLVKLDRLVEDDRALASGS